MNYDQQVRRRHIQRRRKANVKAGALHLGKLADQYEKGVVFMQMAARKQVARIRPNVYEAELLRLKQRELEALGKRLIVSDQPRSRPILSRRARLRRLLRHVKYG